MSLPFGVLLDRSYVEIGDDRLTIRFGLWRLETPTSNIEDVAITGPYRWWKVAGPPHLSFRDRGLTFATASDRGVCISFHEPVAAIDPGGVIRHPGVTVTVDDPDHLADVLARAS